MLVGDAIVHLIKRYRFFVRPAISDHDLNQMYRSMPKGIRHELCGLHKALTDSGYNVPFLHLLELQLIPEISNAACTCIVSTDNGGNIIFGRNMDWLPFSSAQYTLVDSTGGKDIHR